MFLPQAFLVSASHDLRQPLYAVLLFGDALRRKYAATDIAPNSKD
jgi:signal transduction histidine kinase